MRRRNKLEIYLDREERDFVKAFFVYSRSLNRTLQVVNFILHEKGLKPTTRNVVKRYLLKVNPQLVNEVLNEKLKQRKMQRQEEYSLKDLIGVIRR